jgi:hypothetical protein
LSTYILVLLAANCAELKIHVKVGAAAEKAAIVINFPREIAGEFKVALLMIELGCYKHNFNYLPLTEIK